MLRPSWAPNDLESGVRGKKKWEEEAVGPLGASGSRVMESVARPHDANYVYLKNYACNWPYLGSTAGSE